MHNLWKNKRKIPLGRSRGLKWKNKMYKLKRSIDYAVQVFYNAMLQYLINELVCIEKKAISIIIPGTS